jgi:DNA-binding response OmpR family regulator
MSDSARILLVEDDLLVRHPLAEYLRECGYQVLEASDGAEARVLIAQAELPVDIVLAEGDAGFELAGWIRANHGQVQVILAGTVTRAVERAGDLCEDGPALVKPYEHKFVLERIKKLMAARDRAK